MEFFRKKFVGAALYALLLMSFTLYVALDTFVITREYTVVPSGDDGSGKSASNTDDGNADGSMQPSADSAAITADSYSDENISIKIKEYREYDTAIYVADVTLASAEYLQTAFAQSTYGRNITAKTSQIAADNHAILAINGDYYGAQTKGYVLKNGVLYREDASAAKEDLVIRQDGSFEIITEGDYSAAELLEDGAVQLLSFGPALVEGGTVSVSENEEVGKAKASNPRTAIGIVDDLHYLFVVSDGRTNESEGLSLHQLAEFMEGLGADTAYNLDGGGSSTMYFNGEVINNPTTNGKKIEERSVSDIVYIGY